MGLRPWSWRALPAVFFNRGACDDSTVRKVIAPTCRTRRALVVLSTEHATSSTGAPLSVRVLPRNHTDPMPRVSDSATACCIAVAVACVLAAPPCSRANPGARPCTGSFFCALTGYVLQSAFLLQRLFSGAYEQIFVDVDFLKNRRPTTSWLRKAQQSHWPLCRLG